ncbi:MAG: hypothetical protein V4655_12240 [Bdellovibrionota bacterium]|nr:MAG: hypothetical protein EOP10_21410 [Pseudomonadota bacterium]
MHPSTDSGKSEHTSHKRTIKRSARPSDDSESKELDSDADTIFEEVGHFRNRDEMMTDGNRIIQGGDLSDIDDTWTYERYDRLMGDVAQSSEAVDIQLSKVGAMADDVRDSGSHREATPAIPADTRKDEFDMLSDHELESLADSFGIPERQGLSRDKLIRKLRQVEMRGI